MNVWNFSEAKSQVLISALTFECTHVGLHLLRMKSTYLMFLTPLAFNHNHNVDYAYLRCVLYCYDFFAPFHALLFMLD